jgi:hypothetical protein
VVRARDDHRSGFAVAPQNHVEGRLRRAPDALEAARAPITSRSRAWPACAPSAAPTSCDSEVGTKTIVEPA